MAETSIGKPRAAIFQPLTEPYEGFHGMDFAEESPHCPPSCCEQDAKDFVTSVPACRQ